MKRFAIATIIALLTASASIAQVRSVSLSVPGMYCASCPFIVQAAIGAVEGVQSVTADADARTALVLYDDAVASIEAITAASANAGYAASVIVSEPDQG